MKVLIIKMSSMGDITHSFPALTDAGNAIKNIRFDWVVENAFKELPKWHPLVDKVIPVALRQWRKRPIASLYNHELLNAFKEIRKEKYDLIIDAQGLLKSRIVSLLGRGKRCGYDKSSARESWFTMAYHKKFTISKNKHAIYRTRELFANSLNYPIPTTMPDYGLTPRCTERGEYLLFFPNTTWVNKHWPEIYWKKLIEQVTEANHKIQIPWGTPQEEERAKRLANNNPLVTVLPRLSINAVTEIIAKAKAIVSLDTGFTHIAAAYGVPSVSLWGPTDPLLAGPLGKNQISLRTQFPCSPCLKRQCSFPGDRTIDPPCFATLPAEMVFEKLESLL